MREVGNVRHDAIVTSLAGGGREVGIWAAGVSQALTVGPLAGGSLIARVSRAEHIPCEYTDRSHRPLDDAMDALNSARQTGNVLGVALFGALVGQENALIAGARISLIVSTILLLTAAA